MSRLWVVEMWNDERCRWQPTVGVALTREDGRHRLEDWRARNVSDRFRLQSYERAEGEGGQ